MNALVATAENIPTIYFSRTEDDAVYVKGFTIPTFVPLFFNTAIQLGECDCFIDTNDRNKTFKLRGMWAGKTMYNWQNDQIKMEE